MPSDTEDYVRISAPEAHASSHESGGDDEIDITGLTPADHASRHESGGDDEIDITGLTPADHASSHESGGDDEINVTGLVGSGGFVDRGDPSTADYTVGNFITDNTWRDFNLGGLVPVGAVLIKLRLVIESGTTEDEFVFRKNGKVYSASGQGLYIETASTLNQGVFDILCDSNRIIEYRGSDVTFSIINVTVIGWWM